MENAQKRLESITRHISPKHPLIIVLLGAPGAGKGTYARLLSHHYQIPAISTGDLVRQEIRNNSPLGQAIKAISSSGGYIDDQTITEMLKKRISSDDCQHGYILDGYPRTINQALELAKFSDVTLALEVYIPYDVILQTTAGRRVCAKSCGESYNIASIDQQGIVMKPLLPKTENVCNNCSAPLIQREDDREDVVRERLLIYDSQTRPLLDYYKRKNLLITHKVSRGKLDWPIIEKMVDHVIAQRQKQQQQEQQQEQHQEQQQEHSTVATPPTLPPPSPTKLSGLYREHSPIHKQ